MIHSFYVGAGKLFSLDFEPDSEFKKIVEDYEAVIDIMNKSEKFPDNCHADRHIQKELAEELEVYVWYCFYKLQRT